MRRRYVTPKTTGRWQPTREAAEDAAVRAGYGTRNEWTSKGMKRGQFFAHPLVRIEEGDDG